MVTFRKPAAGWSLPPGLDRPEVMAIGDSMYNGMQSISIDAGLAALSPPARVAAGLGVPFGGPDYPEPILLDLEQVMRTRARIFLGGGIGTTTAVVAELLKKISPTLHEVAANGRRWVDRSLVGDGRQRLFDNLALSGAAVEHLLDWDATRWRAQLARWQGVLTVQPDPLQWSLPAGPSEPASGIGDLHMAINGAFLLDPMGEPALAALRPIDQVALRRPRRLLVNIGANHGLVRLTGFGDREGLVTLRHFATVEAPRLMAALAALPAEIETIVVNTMPLPSQAPNLMPVGVWQLRGGPVVASGATHYEAYETRLPLSGAVVRFTGAEVRAMDAEVLRINEAVADLARAADPRIKVFELHTTLAGHDGKHRFPARPDKRACGVWLSAEVASRRRETYYDNRAFDITGLTGFVGRALGHEGILGGLTSLDAHHPSTLGYQIMANGVLQVLGAPGAPLTDRGVPLLEDPPHGAIAAFRIAYSVLGGTTPLEPVERSEPAGTAPRDLREKLAADLVDTKDAADRELVNFWRKVMRAL